MAMTHYGCATCKRSFRLALTTDGCPVCGNRIFRVRHNAPRRIAALIASLVAGSVVLAVALRNAFDPLVGFGAAAVTALFVFLLIALIGLLMTQRGRLKN